MTCQRKRPGRKARLARQRRAQDRRPVLQDLKKAIPMHYRAGVFNGIERFD